MAIIAELTKNSRQSDRLLAKKLHASQPTITRRRGALEKEGLLDYTASTDLVKLGYQIMAITLGNRASHPEHPKLQTEKIDDFVKKHSQLIFAASGAGLGADRVLVSVHKNYADYVGFMGEFRSEWTDFITVVGSFLISLTSDDIPKRLNLKSLVQSIEKNHKETGA